MSIANSVGSVFVSYSHQDVRWKERLFTHLTVMDDAIDVWSDKRVAAGGEWRDEIGTAIDQAAIAILLISPDFLASSFIRDEEVPRLLERHRTQRLRLIPVIVTACQWQRVSWLASLQVRPVGGVPLAALPDHEAEEALSGVAGEVDDLLRDGPDSRAATTNAETGRRVETILADAVARVRSQVVELLERKDVEDERTARELQTKLESTERELAVAKAELEKAVKDTPAYKTFLQRTNRLEGERNQVQTHLNSLDGQRVVDLGESLAAARDSLMRELEKTYRWAEQINFLDARRSRRLDHIYIHLDILLYPRRSRGTSTEQAKTLPFDELLSYTNNHIVLLGQPGAGKTTSMKRLFMTLHARTLDSTGLSIPVVIRFRDLNAAHLTGDLSDAGVLYGPLLRALNVEWHFSEKLLRDVYRIEVREYKRMIATALLDALDATVILDGFDELAGSHRRDAAVAEIRELALTLGRARLVITSRSGDFNFSIDRMDQFEIAPLDEHQIVRFAAKWLGDEELAADFVAQVSKSPFKDTTIRPLSLAHLCAIYERAGSVPDKPKAVYRKVVNLLVEEWDDQRSVRRTSAYQSFTADRRFEFLTSLAFALTSKFDASTFDYEILAGAYDVIHTDFGLPADQVSEVIDEIESHTGLFLRVGYSQFEFAHKSIQEYLAAEHIVRLPRVPADLLLLRRLPNEIAIATAISSDPAAYLCALVFDSLQGQNVERRFYDVFVDRLITERPFFGSSTDAALALIVLVSHWSCRGGRSDSRSTPVEVPTPILERLCTEYSGFIRGPGRKAVLTHYAEFAASSAGFIQMRRSGQSKGHRVPTRLFIPRRLAELIGVA